LYIVGAFCRKTTHRTSRQAGFKYSTDAGSGKQAFQEKTCNLGYLFLYYSTLSSPCVNVNLEKDLMKLRHPRVAYELPQAFG
jgi:hypothetical protein